MERNLLVRHVALLAGLAGLGSGLAFATEPGRESDKVARLEALLESQQRQIERLEREVGGSTTSVEQDQANMMRAQIREILNEREFRESLMPSVVTAGYDNGFYIRSTDDMFLMKFNGLLQFRWTHYDTQSSNRYLLPGVQRDDLTGFDLQRARLAVSGHVYNKDWTYHIEFKADAPQASDFVLDSAWLNYRLADEFQIRVGQMKLASTRAAMNSDAHLQFVDESMFETVYGLGTGVGVRFWGQLFDRQLEYFLDVVNSTSDDGNTAVGRTITPDPADLDSNPAILFRTVWHIMGASDDFVSQADIEFHESPVWDLGFHYAFNDNYLDSTGRGTQRIPTTLPRPFRQGAFALVPTNGLQTHDFGLDTQFKYMGFSTTGEYVVRSVDPRRAGRTPFTPWWLVSGDDSTTAQHGAYLQAGYFLPIPGMEKKLELVARVGGVSVLAEEQDCAWEYAGGLNYYIEGNRIKLQTDVTKVDEAPSTSQYTSLANVNDNALIFRVQLSVAF